MLFTNQVVHPLFAIEPFGSAFTTLAVSGILFAVMLIGVVLLLTKQYKRCPSNRILVIYGKTSRGGAAKTIHGGAAVCRSVAPRVMRSSVSTRFKSKFLCGERCRLRISASTCPVCLRWRSVPNRPS